MERIEKLRAFLAANPEDSFLNHALALEYEKAGETEQARNVFETLLARDPGYVGSYYHLGRLLEISGLAEKAAACYRKGIEIATAQGDHHARGELQAALDELD
ncbi:MAG: tetratricopeptide repeat protein [Chitinophagaceae bacterium]|nr:MAG: tetratricopeptide repeat protein [Chitinophagaceae bacterium]